MKIESAKQQPRAVVYVLDVPEFSAIVQASANTPGVEVRKEDAYWRVSAPRELSFSRRGLRMKPAVWWGLFTGGLVGRIAEMTPNYVRIVAEPQEATHA